MTQRNDRLWNILAEVPACMVTTTRGASVSGRMQTTDHKTHGKAFCTLLQRLFRDVSESVSIIAKNLTPSHLIQMNALAEIAKNTATAAR